ncbi:FHA domain-containing protein [Galbitalea sp. SE-J8]|uniref:FHA domain-containing protein n=1 Tax=Galbitalea sp. SE-J8 TaxID=3054952 RepID=UPI00259CEE5B|nr:FHA domain-containing protein [Galbitalea sp. SE-J8]MDM4762671.1 FHA domain-containing protein [Galbitalea sp. SE-J8]
MARSRRRPSTAPDATMPTVSVADVEAWRASGALAAVHRTPVPAPRTVDSVVAAAGRVGQDGQFGYYRPTDLPARAVARFTFEDGRFLDVIGDGLVGRDPGDPGDPGDPRIRHVISLDDSRRELSRVHLTFGVTPERELWIADQHSTNGVQITRRDRGTVPCAPGVRTTIDQGDIVTFAGHAMSVTRLLPIEPAISRRTAAESPAG